LQAGQSRFRFLLRPRDPSRSGSRPPAARQAHGEEEAGQTVMAGPGQLGSVLLERPFLLSGIMQIGRQADAVHIHLPHPQVSRRHARIECHDGTAVLDDLGSANGTFVNGRRISTATALRPGDQIDIGPYALQFTGTALIPRPRSDNVELVARGLCRAVTDRDTGQPLTLLDDITLVIRPREFVCLLGPSGSGKSTLLSALSGRAPADEGAVLLNGTDLYANFDAVKQDMVVVPQKDVLHESLRVGQALWYTARLRLPPDTSNAEIESCLTEMLDTVGLTHRCATAIRHLSGGQIKRASLANEILCKPSLLFLDEVTSGLDEQTDREMMDLFRSLADAGKTVVCITHSLANVERTCHLVLILAPGGKLAFLGKPAEALHYFRIDRLGDVYDRLADFPAEHWQRAFLASPYHKRYITDRLHLKNSPSNPDAAGDAQGNERVRTFFRQAGLLARRYFAVWLGDWPALAAMAGQALLVAVLLGVLFGDLERLSSPVEHAQRSINVLFLLAVSSFWFGCNNAAKEIVKERTIYVRERDFNLLAASYYTSKLLLLTAFSGLQAVLLYAIVRLWCGVPGAVATEMLVLLALALAGVTLGLVISTASATEEMALTLIPMAVIPQIILSGVIAPLQGWSKALALAAITTYWGKRGLDACLPEEVARAVGLEQHPAAGAVAVLLAHAAVGVVVALALLHWQGRRR
jgi:ABC-type multidrug transport system ATPase subunit